MAKKAPPPSASPRPSDPSISEHEEPEGGAAEDGDRSKQSPEPCEKCDPNEIQVIEVGDPRDGP